MPGRQDDVPAGRAQRGRNAPAAPAPSRSPALGTAVALAVVATLAAVLTSDVAVLRGGVVVAAWAVVAAAYVAVTQVAERRLAAQREQELRAAAVRVPGGGPSRDDEDLRAELTRLRQEVAALGGLRDELAALRTELAGSVDAEMLVERILLRTRGSRPADRPAPADEPAAATSGADALPATDGPPRELTGDWSAVQLDLAPSTRAYERVGRERGWDPLVDPLPADLGTERPRYERDRYDPAAWRDDLLGDAPTAPPEESGPSTGPVAATRPRPVPHRRRQADGSDGAPADPATAAHPAPRAPLPPRPAAQPDPGGRDRLGGIPGDGGGPATGSRPRHRHRADDAADDVLSRVLRGE